MTTDSSATTEQRHAPVANAVKASTTSAAEAELLEQIRWICHTGGVNDEGEQDGDLMAVEVLAAVLPTIHAEVAKAQVEALREAANDMSLRLSRHSGAIGVLALRLRATKIEKEQSHG